MLTKPEKGSGRDARRLRAAERRAEQSRIDKAAERQKAQAWAAMRRYIYLRDERKCRATRRPVLLSTDGLMKLGHVHHLIYRSHGGPDTPENLLLLSAYAHQKVHDGLLEISGDPNGVVTFTEFEYKGGTRNVLRVWEG